VASRDLAGLRQSLNETEAAWARRLGGGS
jgi:hypothetical protein